METGIGGSIPFIAEFARTFPGAAVLVTGVGDPASRWHGIDESLHLGMFGRGVLAEALLLRPAGRERLLADDLDPVAGGQGGEEPLGDEVLPRCRQPAERVLRLPVWNAMPGWKNTEYGIGASNWRLW